MSAGSSEFVYMVEAAQFQHEIQAMTKRQNELRKEIGRAASESKKGSQEAAAGLAVLVGQYNELDQALKIVRQDYATLQASAKKAGDAQQQAATKSTALTRLAAQQQQVVAQLSFAVDDALTVWGQQGFAGAMRAAGNNLSYVTSIIHPTLAILPALGTAIATMVVPRFFAAAEASKEAAAEIEKQRSAIESLRAEYARLGKPAEQFDEEQKQNLFAAAMQQATAKREAIARQIQEQEKEAAKIRVVGVGPHGAAGEIRGQAAAQKRIAALREELAVATTEQETLQENERRRRAAVAEGAARKQASQTIGAIDAPLRQAAATALKQGMPVARVQREIEASLAARLPAPQRGFAAEFAGKIVAAATEDEQARRVGEAMAPIDRTEAMRRRQRDLSAQVAQIEARRIEAEAASPRGKLRPREAREFERELEPLRLEQRRLQAQLALQRNDDELATELRRQSDILAAIREALERQPANSGDLGHLLREPVM